MIKVRLPGEKRFLFLTPSGQLNALRVHAARWEDGDGVPGEERAARFITDSVAPSKPGWETKAVKA